MFSFLYLTTGEGIYVPFFVPTVLYVSFFVPLS